jgi:hypothetical protein
MDKFWENLVNAGVYIAAFNVLLYGAKAAVDSIKDKTASSLDDKASSVLGAITGFIAKILDMIGYNPEHKK